MVDKGLQSERTRLAWVRTAALLAAGALGAAGVALSHGAPVWVATPFALAALIGAVLLLRTGVRFRRVQRALRDGHPLDVTADARLVWLGTLALVVGALAVVIDAAA
ncbi:DUF202 domain-containing protein [Sphaerimonospora sp. CA-214678]|uniref:DUF202 domain-containing protein n=1 Tax=Sphaerimonospora sp. CA-214678 TaxID=3240029 RepID=UPI003D8BE03C